MPYAAEGKISTSPIPGGVEIIEAQYQQALAGIAQGKIISIEGGFSVADPPPPPEPEPEPEPTLEEKREAARLDRVAFLEGMVSLGVFDEDTAVEAADGSWPTAIDPLLASMSFKDKLQVKSEWKKNDIVPYQGLVMETVAAYTQTEESPVTITQPQLDTLFGVTA